MCRRSHSLPTHHLFSSRTPLSANTFLLLVTKRTFCGAADAARDEERSVSWRNVPRPPLSSSGSEKMPISVHNANYLRRAVQSHRRKVQSLYKRAVRNLESWTNFDRPNFLYQKTLLRKEFDDNAGIKDLRKAKVLMMEAEEKLFNNLHPRPMIFPFSPGGICFERYMDYPDLNVDYWHPLEKAQYPHYFAKREAAKLEYLKLYEKSQGVNPEIEATVTHYQEYNEEPLTEEQKKYGPFLKPSKGAVDSGKVPPEIDQQGVALIQGKH